jgi:hypothetical protein
MSKKRRRRGAALSFRVRVKASKSNRVLRDDVNKRNLKYHQEDRMDFVVEADTQNERRIAVYPSPTSGYHIIISLSANRPSEPDVTLRQAESENEVSRILEKEGVPPVEIHRHFPKTRTNLEAILTTIAGSLPIGLLLAMALVPVLESF